MKELLIEIRDYLQNELLETDHRVSFFAGAIEIDWCSGKNGEEIKADLESFVKRIDEAVRQEEAVHFDERIAWKKANPRLLNEDDNWPKSILVKDRNFQSILAAKREYYGHTEAAIEFAAEEYARRLIEQTKTEE